MLSRIAEALYWLGRYCERVECTSRIVGVYAQALLEDRRGEEPSACARLLEVMAATSPDEHEADEHEIDTDTLVSVLVDDARFAGSIRRSLGSAWENARGAREAISSEMWESINTTYRLADARRGGASAFARQSYLDWVRDRAATLAGLTDSTMSRDDGWRFIVLGRSLERVDVTARLLSTRLGDAWGSSGWTTMLRACSAQEAYVRSLRTGVDGRRALEFMLLNRHFPRSVFRALSEAEGILFELDPGSDRNGARSEARRVVGRACAELEFVHVDELEIGLGDHLVRLEAAVLAAHDAIAARFFHSTAAISWVQG